MEGRARFADRSVAAFVDDVASPAPVPGGGSASAVTAAIAAGLVAMVASLSDRPRYAEHGALHVRVVGAARDLAAAALVLADEDAAAYGRLAAALKLPRATETEQADRRSAIAAAARVAADVPLRTARTCRDIAAAAESLAGRSNVNAASDLVVAGLLAEAAGRGAALNVEVNLPSVDDPVWIEQTGQELARLVEESTTLVARIRAVVSSGEARPPIDSATAVPSTPV